MLLSEMQQSYIVVGPLQFVSCMIMISITIADPNLAKSQQTLTESSTTAQTTFFSFFSIKRNNEDVQVEYKRVLLYIK